MRWCWLWALAVSSQAATISHFASAVGLAVAGSQFQNDFQLGPGLTSNSAAVGFTNPDGAIDSAAQSNLANGTLRVAANATSFQTTSSALARGVASFGDSFRFFGSLGPTSPFVFTLSISGSFLTSPGFDPNNNLSQVEIQIRSPGGLAPGGLTGDTSILTRKAYRIGPGSNQNNICLNPSCTAQGFETIEVIDTFPQTIRFEFIPGGDFDFEVFFRLDGRATGAGEFFLTDFSHTASLSFEGPTPYSGSGAFPGTLPLAANVPEPNSLWLVGGAALGLVCFKLKGIPK